MAVALLGLAAWTYSSGSSAVPGAIGSAVTTPTTGSATTAPPPTIGPRKLVIQVRNATGGLPILVVAASMLKTA